jgi:type I restriction enzyme R subunit
MLYEIISPDAFLRPYMEAYATLSGIYDVVRAAYATTVYVDRAFQRKTNSLVQEHVGTSGVEKVHDLFEINKDTIELIKEKEGGATTKVINLIKSIQKTAEAESDDPFLIAMAERAKAVQEKFEDRQAATAEVLEELFKLVENNERRKKEQAEKGFDGLTYFVYRTMLDAGLSNPEEVSKKIKSAFVEHAGWKQSEKELRELRKKVTFAICEQEDNLDKVTSMVDELFTLLSKANRI